MIIVEAKAHPLQQTGFNDRLDALGANPELVKFRTAALLWKKAAAENKQDVTKDDTIPEDKDDDDVLPSPFMVVTWGNAMWIPLKNKYAKGESIVIDVKAVAAEFITMSAFVFFGCGSAMGNGASDAAERVLVAFTFGMSIMILAYSVAHHSGGHINCAVTLALVISGITPWYMGVLYLISQLLGSLLGAGLLAAVYSCDADLTGGIGSNVVNLAKFSKGQAVLAEVLGTFLLVYVIFETAVSSNSSTGKNACLVIGFAVFVVHLVLLPIDGCSINPTRSFGPAIISAARKCGPDDGLRDLWVMWVGPLIGALFAAAVYSPFSNRVVIDDDDDDSDSDEDTNDKAKGNKRGSAASQRAAAGKRSRQASKQQE